MSVVIEVENVVRTFKTERVIDNASFVLSSCGVSALVAPNGSGKTTLMSIIAGLMEPTEGRVLFSDGEGTSDVALLLAGDKNLYMKNTVMENLMYFAALNGYGRGDIQGDIDDVVSGVEGPLAEDSGIAFLWPKETGVSGQRGHF